MEIHTNNNAVPSSQPRMSLVATAAAGSLGPTPLFLSGPALDRLELELKRWREASPQGMSSADAFRYEMFARRIVAAQYGRPDAVAWAWDWFCTLLAEDIVAAQAKQAAIDEAHYQKVMSRAELSQGVSGNPYFQAFLDTLEDPGKELYDEHGTFLGWKYLLWIGPLLGQIKATNLLSKEPHERTRQIHAELQRASASQRSKRLGGPIDARH